MALENRSARNTTMVKIGNRNYKVFKKIPKNIEDKLLAH